MIDAFRIAATQPWAIEPAALETVLQVADRLGNPEALATRMGRPLANTHNVEIRNDVAIIPIRGPIFRHAGLFTAISGATSTGTLAQDFQSALDNPAVKTIVLDIDSPGGEVTGIHELARQVHAARGKKAIKAYIGGTGASAAYWIASAASEVIANETALIGSIGVVSSYVDTSQRDEKAGIRRIEIVSSSSPQKRLDPATADGRAAAQKLVDSLGDIFVTAVALNRGVTAKKVIADFGRGYVMTGAEAVRAGMVDRLGSLEGVISGKVERHPHTAVPRRSAAVAVTGAAAITTQPNHTTVAAPGGLPSHALSPREVYAMRAAAMRPSNAASATADTMREQSMQGRPSGSAAATFARRAAAMRGTRAPAIPAPGRSSAEVYAARRAVMTGTSSSGTAPPRPRQPQSPSNSLAGVFGRRRAAVAASKAGAPGQFVPRGKPVAQSADEIFRRRKADMERLKRS